MKSSLEKLRKLALHKSDAKERRDHQSLAQLDELAQATQVSNLYLLIIIFNYVFMFNYVWISMRLGFWFLFIDLL